MKLYGLGYGHGVGMSQHGARGRALAGQTAEQILAAYFKGATLSTTSPTRLTRVRVLSRFAAPSTAPLVLVGRGGTWGFTGTETVFPADAQLRAWRTIDDDRRCVHHDLAGQGAGARRDDRPPLGHRHRHARHATPRGVDLPPGRLENVDATTSTAAASCSCSVRAG